MEKIAYIFLANGFEETEAIGTWDTLIRGGVCASFVSIYDQYEVEGAHGLRLNACMNLKDINDKLADAIILPGGMPGAMNLYECEDLRKIIQVHFDANKILAAICAAPLVYGKMGLLEGKTATCYPGFETELKGANTIDEPVWQDDKIITGRGPAYAFDFGITILQALVGTTKATEVAEGLLLIE